jgi:hypothetical protein
VDLLPTRLRPIGKEAQSHLQNARRRAILTASTKHRHMETLDLDILNMISALEADLDVEDFDADDDLEEV